jgi:hypothetical protein
MNKACIVILFNIGSLFLSIDSYILVNRYEGIINENKIIKDYEIVNVYCEVKRSSSVKLKYHDKIYFVSIYAMSYSNCTKFEEGIRKIDFYYDEIGDEIFTKYSINIKMVVFFFIFFLFTLGFWLLPRKYW